MAITISPDATKQAVGSIKRYFAENLDLDIGDLKAGLLLEYFLTELGPTIYNTAIADAQGYFQQKTTDLDGACYQKEFGFWPPSTKRSGA